MGGYLIRFSSASERDYAALNKGDRRSIDGLIERLASWPDVSGVAPLWGPGHGQFRMKTRGLRMIFTVDRASREILINRIADRGTVYEEFH